MVHGLGEVSNTVPCGDAGKASSDVADDRRMPWCCDAWQCETCYQAEEMSEEAKRYDDDDDTSIDDGF